MISWTDAHCHLQERYLGDDPAVRVLLDETLTRSHDAGVHRIIVVGTDATTSREALALAEDADGPVEIYATVGIHPHDAESGTASLTELVQQQNRRLVGIGECGLDYFYEHAPRQAQRQAFSEQIALAHEHDLALVIHARDAWEDLYAVLDSEGMPPRTVIHCFTGGPAEAEACLARGADISISGIVTFKNAADIRDALHVVPLDRLHVETDSPFLAPVPHRGKTNEPAWVVAVGTFVAEFLGLEPELVARQTSQNTARLFGISGTFGA